MLTASFDAAHSGDGEALELVPFPLEEFSPRGPRRFDKALAQLQAELGTEANTELLDRISEFERSAATLTGPSVSPMISLNQCLLFCADCARLGAIVCADGIKEFDWNCSEAKCRFVCY